MRLMVLACFLSSAALGAAQMPEASAERQLSPEAAYDRASAPVDITHRDILNWSDIELNALSIAIEQAKGACVEREQVKYLGDHLIAFARLCALGQQWTVVYRAATDYINSGEKERPQLAQAYAFEVQADLNMRNERDALGASIAMLKSVPYSALVDDVTTGAVRYMQFAYPGDALELLINRQRVLLGLLSGTQPVTGDWPVEPTVSPIPLHTVVEHALEDAALHQYMGRPDMAARIVQDIDDALPKQLPPDEAILIAAERRRYALLGTRMPELNGAVSLVGAAPMPVAKPVFGNVTVFLLFPPWCAQCVRLGPELQPAVEREAGKSGVKIYALLADAPPPELKQAAAKSGADPAARRPGPHGAVHRADETQARTPEDLLRKTPTLVVPPETLNVFAASDFPILIATDHDGIIRLLYPAAPNNALVQDGIVDQLTLHILSHWPPPGMPHPKAPAEAH